MEKSIILIVAYFGDLPCWFELWLKSCKSNWNINWLLITDDRGEYNYPSNVRVEYMDMNNLKNLIDTKLKLRSNIINPYKLCDFKPTYGIVFEDYIGEYNFWGHCDIDLIFGDLREFITEDILLTYNKILRRGHLTIYRNNEIVNNYYKLKEDYKRILEDSNNRVFDEAGGIVKTLDENEIDQYHDEFIADIVVEKEKFMTTKLKNYKYQVFIYDNGKVYREYLLNGKKQREEVAYIHFQKRKYNYNNIDDSIENKFFIGPKGFKKYYELNSKKDYLELNQGSILYTIDYHFKRIKKKYFDRRNL